MHAVHQCTVGLHASKSRTRAFRRLDPWMGQEFRPIEHRVATFVNLNLLQLYEYRLKTLAMIRKRNFYKKGNLLANALLRMQRY